MFGTALSIVTLRVLPGPADSCSEPGPAVPRCESKSLGDLSVGADQRLKWSWPDSNRRPPGCDPENSRRRARAVPRPDEPRGRGIAGHQHRRRRVHRAAVPAPAPGRRDGLGRRPGSPRRLRAVVRKPRRWAVVPEAAGVSSVRLEPPTSALCGTREATWRAPMRTPGPDLDSPTPAQPGRAASRRPLRRFRPLMSRSPSAAPLSVHVQRSLFGRQVDDRLMVVSPQRSDEALDGGGEAGIGQHPHVRPLACSPVLALEGGARSLKRAVDRGRTSSRELRRPPGP